MNQEIFINLCKVGNIDKIKEMYSSGNIDNNSENIFDGFIECCRNGHLELAKWMHDKLKINIFYRENDPFVESCKYGHLHVAKWLHDELHNDLYDSRAITESLKNGHIDVARWVLSKTPYSNRDFIK